MMIMMKYIRKIIYATTMISFFIMVVIIISGNDDYNCIRNIDNLDSDNELIVLFNETLNQKDIEMLLYDYKDSLKIVKHLDDYALIYIEESEVYRELLNYLDNHRLVKSVEPNGSIHLMQVTDDPYSSSQWAIHNPGHYSLFAPKTTKKIPAIEDIDMEIPEAWGLMNQEITKRREVVVAIIDTGVDYTHPDLEGHIWVNKNEIANDGLDNDNNGYVDDIYGWDFYNDDASVSHYKYDKNARLNLSLPEDNDDHGTHIAGIIAAVADNGIGIAGVASNIDVKLMILKINGGTEGTGSISDAILAIKYATRMGADICNISWGTTIYSPGLEVTIKESDMLFVAAAGNLGSDNDSKAVYPASFNLDNLISVTFIDADGRLTRLSNYGKNSVDIAAPGTDIMSTAVGSYQTLSGSSMAAPQVSSIAALLYSYDRNLYPLAIKNTIINTLKPISGLKEFILYPGIPNAYNALLEVGKVGGDYVSPIIKAESIYDRGGFIVPIKVEDTGGSGLRVVRWLTGIREIEAFSRGTTGLAVENNQINVSKAGSYTIYASDYAGNESLHTHVVEEDTKPPSINYSFSVSEDYKTRTVTIRVTDRQSGVRRVKYMAGTKKVADFLPAGAGREVKIENNYSSFDVNEDGIYTLYAIDNRGNHTVKQIDIKTVLSLDVKFARSDMALRVGESSYLRAFVKPANTTDLVTYTSSNDRVVLINSKGKIVALREGVATITARANSGKKAVLRVVVSKHAP